MFGDSEVDLRVMGCFVEVCRRRGLKANTDKWKVMVLGREEGLEYEVCIDNMIRACLGFKYLGCVLDKSGTDEAECHRKVMSGRRVVSAIRTLVNARGLELECARGLA